MSICSFFSSCKNYNNCGQNSKTISASCLCVGSIVYIKRDIWTQFSDVLFSVKALDQQKVLIEKQYPKDVSPGTTMLVDKESTTFALAGPDVIEQALGTAAVNAARQCVCCKIKG